jgi:hypothetical protein
VLALPDLLTELKARGYRIVHVAVAGPERPKTVTAPEQWVVNGSGRRAWPRIVEAAQLPAPSPQSFGWPDIFRAQEIVATTPIRLKLTWRDAHQTVRIVETRWPEPVAPVAVAAADALPAPSPQSFGIPHPFGPNLAPPMPRDPAETPAALSERPPLQPIARPQPVRAAAPVNH